MKFEPDYSDYLEWLEKEDKVPHEWVPSPYGHGEQACIHCMATNREIAVIGDLNHCPDRVLAAQKRKDQ